MNSFAALNALSGSISRLASGFEPRDYMQGRLVRCHCATKASSNIITFYFNCYRSTECHTVSVLCSEFCVILDLWSSHTVSVLCSEFCVILDLWSSHTVSVLCSEFCVILDLWSSHTVSVLC